ncbi:phosphatidylethanolamine-binding protein [Bombardia bombarda]|uniref:Phosphatidylethanolamine-binding protein n=1 Tax=Bombardia bombarda TaxID=252184 RepID=A0AA40CEE6_9PEZI|nr:phosphatidylethanolamine-binding protein [Bombardia bombarda]
MVVLGYLAALVAAATVSLARTPDGFQPASNADLIVAYGNATAPDGAVVARAATQAQPRIGTSARLNGTSYAILMVDLDIPTASPPATNTLLHWLQTNLTPAAVATTFNTSLGPTSVFFLENRTSTAPLAAYIGPAPPARIPLSHRYTFVLIDTSNITSDDVAVLRAAAGTRLGFGAEETLTEAGLVDGVVAGTSFNVTNPGPVEAVNATATAAGTGTGTTPAATTTAAGSGSGSTSVTSGGRGVGDSGSFGGLLGTVAGVTSIAIATATKQSSFVQIILLESLRLENTPVSASGSHARWRQVTLVLPILNVYLSTIYTGQRGIIVRRFNHLTYSGQFRLSVHYHIWLPSTTAGGSK